LPCDVARKICNERYHLAQINRYGIASETTKKDMMIDANAAIALLEKRPEKNI